MKKRFYKSWIMFFNDESPSLWTSNNCMMLYKTIDPLVLLCRPKPKFDVCNVENRKVVQPNTLIWNEKNMAKWTHDSPINSKISSNWRFSSLSLSCPDIITARKLESRPDLLLEFWKWDAIADSGLPPAFDQMLSISIGEDIISTNSLAYRGCIERLLTFLRPIFVAHLRSRWIFRKNQYTTQTLESGFPSGTMNHNWRKVADPSIEMFDLDNGAEFQILNVYRKSEQQGLSEFFENLDWSLSSCVIDFAP